MLSNRTAEAETFDVQHSKYLSYAKLKIKAHKKKRRRIKSLLNLLTRGLNALQRLLNSGQLVDQLNELFYEYLRTIKQVFQQQSYLITTPVTECLTALYHYTSLMFVRSNEVKKISLPGAGR